MAVYRNFCCIADSSDFNHCTVCKVQKAEEKDVYKRQHLVIKQAEVCDLLWDDVDADTVSGKAGATKKIRGVRKMCIRDSFNRAFYNGLNAEFHIVGSQFDTSLGTVN